MPNYLTQSTGRPNASNTAGSKSDMYYVDPMYKSRIFNQDYSIQFEGKIPEDFALNLAGNWGEGLESAFMDAQGAVLGSAQRAVEIGAQATGLSTRFHAATARTWESSSYLSLSLPISIYAYADSQVEVIEKLQNILQLTAPKSKGGLLQSPGPSPIKNILDQNGGAFANQMAENLKGQILTVQIGTFFTMSPVVVQNVSASFDGLMEHGTGNPISVSCILEVESFFAVTKDDVLKWLHGGNGV